MTMQEGQHNQEQEYYQRLQQDRHSGRVQQPQRPGATQAQPVRGSDAAGSAQQQLRDTAQAAEQEAVRLQQLRIAQHKNKKGMDLSSPDGLAKTASAASSAYTEISPSQDWYHWLVIMLALMGDLGTIVPFGGITIGFAIYVAIITVYVMNGHFKKRTQVKVFVTGLSWFFETIPFLEALPCMTGSAVLNYWFTLTERKASKT